MELTATINRSGTVLDGKMALAPCTATEKVAAHNVSMDAHPHIREAIHKVSSYSDIVCTQMGDVVSVQDASERKLAGLHVYGKTTQNGTPAPEAPVELVSAGASGAINAKVAGKNLIPYPYVDTTKTVNGITFTDNGDGTITANGTAIAQATFKLMPATAIRGIFTLSGCSNGGGVGTYNIQPKVDGVWSGSNYDTGSGKQITVNSELSDLVIGVMYGATVNNLVFKPQLEVGTKATAYEPYKPTQTITVSTPNGLPGIPVSSGGNYTDENGQAWVCDEIDFARGVYVQRVQAKEFDGTETFTRSGSRQFGYNIPDCIGTANTIGDALCSHFIYSTSSFGGSTPVTGFVTHNKYAYFRKTGLAEDSVTAYTAWLVEQYNAGNPVKLLYLLLEPIEMPLSAEELAAFAALHSNKPNTTVYNDAGAGLAVEYVADTKNYIDNKFTELQNAILSAGANI